MTDCLLPLHLLEAAAFVSSGITRIIESMPNHFCVFSAFGSSTSIQSEGTTTASRCAHES